MNLGVRPKLIRQREVPRAENKNLTNNPRYLGNGKREDVSKYYLQIY